MTETTTPLKQSNLSSHISSSPNSTLNNSSNLSVISSISTLPFKTSQEEFDAFNLKIHDNDNQGNDNKKLSPKDFNKNLVNLSHLLSKLNYQFLELDSKQRFLRLILLGSHLTHDEVNKFNDELIELNEKILFYENKINVLKSSGKLLRRKVLKCIFSAEIKKILENKDVLKNDIDYSLKELKNLESFFESEGFEINDDQNENIVIVDINELELELGNLIGNIRLLSNKIDDFNIRLKSLKENESSVDKEIEDLEDLRDKLQKELKSFRSKEGTLDDEKIIKKYESMNKLIELWQEKFVENV